MISLSRKKCVLFVHAIKGREESLMKVKWNVIWILKKVMKRFHVCVHKTIKNCEEKSAHFKDEVI